MCTVIARHGTDYWCRTLIAANRDEFTARASKSPLVLSDNPKIVGGLDEVGGGTWLGVRENGAFMALTNQRNWGRRDDSLKSRGRVIIDALSAGDLEATKEQLMTIDPREYNEFNLMFGDGKRLWAAHSGHENKTLTLKELGFGVHVLTNEAFGAPDLPKAKRLKTRARRISRMTWPKLRTAFIELLSDGSIPDDYEPPAIPKDSMLTEEMLRALQATCIHLPGYGTVSSTLLAVKEGEVLQHQFADGRPCEAEFIDVNAIG